MGGAWYEVVGGIGAGVGGIGAAVGAAAAWRAASASKETSRDAADALALSLAPHLGLETVAIGESVPSEGGFWQARITNDSRFAALDIVLEAHFADGERVHREIERLAPGGFELLTLREIPAPPVGPTAAQAGRSMVLRYSDERRLWRYEASFAFLVSGHDGSPTGAVIADGEAERIG